MREQLVGQVFNVQRASFHDGPGVRTTVFLKGCPLRCPWCHNPEGMAAAPEVSVSAVRCAGCGACRDVCPRPAGPLPAGGRIGEDGCTACGACLAACPAAAREQVGRTWTVAEVMAEVLRDRLAYDTSGGGVTFSGGEPLAQPAFLLACLDACLRHGVHAAVDTCGFAPREVVEAVAARADLLLWDVKHADPDRHLALTGAPLAAILANLEAAARSRVRIWLRVPLVPGLTGDEAHLALVARLARELPGVERVSLLPYHRTAAGKRARLGRDDGLGELAAPPPEAVRRAADRLASAGVEAAIGG